ncbi:MAG: hypothetical protein HQM11_06270 [SAR324 cluster bacterium]|nr:hypothetical protein [SAR324 cluster bacterium]
MNDMMNQNSQTLLVILAILLIAMTLYRIIRSRGNQAEFSLYDKLRMMETRMEKEIALLRKRVEQLEKQLAAKTDHETDATS